MLQQICWSEIKLSPYFMLNGPCGFPKFMSQFSNQYNWFDWEICSNIEKSGSKMISVKELTNLSMTFFRFANLRGQCLQ